MKQLAELEKKVLALVAERNQLKSDCDAAHAQVQELKAKVDSLEASLLKESGTTAELSSENQSICSSIDELLENIELLQSEQAEEQQ